MQLLICCVLWFNLEIEYDLPKAAHLKLSPHKLHYSIIHTILRLSCRQLHQVGYLLHYLM